MIWIKRRPIVGQIERHFRKKGQDQHVSEIMPPVPGVEESFTQEKAEERESNPACHITQNGKKRFRYRQSFAEMVSQHGNTGDQF